MTHTKSEELFRRAVEKIPGGVNSQTRINTNTYVAFSCFIRFYRWPYFLGVSSHDTYQIRRTVSPRGGKDSGWRELAGAGIPRRGGTPGLHRARPGLAPVRRRRE